MFHRIFRGLLFCSLLTVLTPILQAQDCPDTQPYITGADIVCDQNSSMAYVYRTPATIGYPPHSYLWEITAVTGPANGFNIDGAVNLDSLKVRWLKPGTYRLKVTEWNNDPQVTGCTGIQNIRTITVQPLLHAYYYYEFDTAHGCYYNVVKFTGDVSVHPTNDPITYKWDFGDGTVITNAPAIYQHTFSTTPDVTYPVKLTVTNTAGFTDEIIDYVYVNPDMFKPTARFTNSATPVPTNCLYNPMTFDASTSSAKPVINPDTAIKITEYEWNFDDPGSGSQNNIVITTNPLVSHVFTTPGLHKVTLKVTNTKYCFHTVTKDIFIDNSIPNASFENTMACLGESTKFISTSVSPVGTITKLNWFFGDTYTATSFNPADTIIHTYSSLDIYPAQLVITNSNGCVSTPFIKGVPVNPSPMASFLVGNACLGEAVQFTNTSTLNGGSQIISYLWNFDDPISGSNSSSAANPTHLFSAVGNYNVSLEATNSDGCANTYTISPPLTVSPKPSVDFTFSNGTLNWQILFHNITGGSVGNNLVWDFGDGTFGYGPDPSHVYQGPGNFLVTLTATDALNGCSNTIQKQVSIQGTQSAYFTTDSPKCLGDTMHFTPQIPGGAIVKEVWNFGDGNIVTYLPPVYFPVFATHIYTQSGTFTVTRTVTYSSNFYESFSLQVEVFPQPTANFTYSNNAGFPNTWACANQPVYFTDLSIPVGGNIIDWQWNFGDPGSGIYNSSTLQNPQHTFSASDSVFHVTLTVTDNVNLCKHTIVKNVYVNPPVPVDFTFTNNTCLNQVVDFNANQAVMVPGTIGTWDWDFGDGSAHATSPLAASHLYASAGTYTAVLTVTDVNGCTNSVSKTVTVMPRPVPGFTFASPTCDSVAVQFTDQSYVPAGYPGFISQWIWVWGDGKRDTVNHPQSPNLSHVFPGLVYNFNVKLIVKSSFGCIDSLTRNVTLIPAPVAAFEVEPGTPSCATQVTQFNDLSQTNGGGNIVSWLWNFDDPPSGGNNTSTSPNPSHIFNTPKTYMVSLTVTNANGCSHTKVIPIVINPLPVANFRSDTACAGAITTFTNLSQPSSTAITSYSWSFGDGNTSTLPEPQHTYATYGVYYATLMITNINGCINSITKPVVVQPKPVPAFTFSPAGCIGNPVSFTDLSFIPAGFSGYIQTWIWDFDDNSPRVIRTHPQSPNVTHTFLGNATSHNVKLIVITSSNCSDSIVQTVNSVPSPLANFAFSDITCATQDVQFTDLTQPNGGSSIQTWNWNFGDPLSGANNSSALKNPIHAFTKAGPFTVTLTVNSINGCVNSKDTIIVIDTLPVANFTYTAACENNPTYFRDTSQANASSIISYSWNFGDGGTSNLRYPEHTYLAYGTYIVTLTVTNSNNCIHTVSKPVVVNPKPVAQFNFSPASCVGNPVSYYNQSFVPAGFTASIIQWIWDFGDGTVPDTINFPGNPNITHIFAGNATSHVVRLTITTSTGCTSFIEKTVTSIPSPIGNFSFSNTRCLGQSVQFSDLTQNNGGGSIQSWNWNFGDPASGTNNISTLQNPTHIFSDDVPFTVTLVVTSTNGCVNTKDTVLNINPLPVANFIADTVCEGQATPFTNTSVSNSTGWSSFLWNFGDGITSTLQNPTHTYPGPGFYTVVLTVVNDSSCSHTKTKQIYVYPKPVAAFSHSPAGCIGTEMLFFDQSYIPVGFPTAIKKWVWDFGDGNPTITRTFPENPNVSHVFNGPGTSYIVRLTVYSTTNCEQYTEKTINVVAAPVANFTYSSSLCAGQPVQFTDLSQSNGGAGIQSWSWNFGDPPSGGNNTSNLQNPLHSFTSSLSYDVTLVVTNSNGCKDTLTKQNIQISPRPTSNFTADTACLGSVTGFTSNASAGVTSHLWSFGDGTTSTDINPVHLYASAGVFNVTLTVTQGGCIKDTIKQVLVLQKPVAAFSYSSPNCAGDSIQFTDLSSTSHGYIDKWTWDFGDGTPLVVRNFPQNQNVKHLFANGGNYNVKLTIETTDDCVVEKINQVQVGFTPMANFSFGNVGCKMMPLQFNDLSQTNGGPAITQWSWNFGDPASGTNNTSITQNPFHSFTAAATYWVKLKVTNANGCVSKSDSAQVTINDAPVASFEYDTACLGSPTQFTSTSTTPGTIASYLWNFGDPASGANNTSTDPDPVHVFSSSGVYTVILLVTNNNQCEKDTAIEVTVNPKPVAMFEYTAACEDSETQFTDLSIAPGSSISTWNWDFGDGGTATIANPVHTYANPGTYQVTLVVKNLDNCYDSVTIPVVSRTRPVAKFDYSSYFCPQGRIDFQDISTTTGATITNRLWTFSTYGTSTVANPFWVFPATDSNYLVTLVVTDTYGCKDTIDSTVYVKPGFDFTFRYDTVCYGFPTKFYPVNLAVGDTLFSVSWNFGDPGAGNTSNQYYPSHTFSRPGTFAVKMKAYNSDNCVDSIYKEVKVYALPEPKFSFVSTPCDSTIYFTDSTMVIGDGTIAQWVWHWGDTTANDTIYAPGPGHASHKYRYEGLYPVKLELISSYGCKNSVTKMVRRYPCISASFTTLDTICAGSTVIFNDSSVPTERINLWTWNWGDGTPPTTYTTYTPAVTHTFVNAGTYMVSLQIRTQINGSTIIDAQTTPVIVRPTPQTFFANPAVCLNQVTLFRDTTKTYGEPITNHHWTFSTATGDTSILKNPPHRYDTAGIYNVTLITTNRLGCSDTLTKPTRVYGLPEAHYTNTVACTGDPTFFSDLTVPSDTILRTWRWYFGDPLTLADSSRLQDPVYKYQKTGQYNVSMIVKDYFGCADTVDSVLTVYQTPLASFTLIDDYNGRQGQVKLNNFSSGSKSYFWDFGNGRTSTEENPVATFTEDDTYTIMLVSKNEYECSDTSLYDYKLLFKGLYVPNAFAPTSTNLGVRLFQPVGMNLKQYHVQVFDMWGHMIWESTKLDEKGIPTEGWDGHFEGKLMPQGNYMWKISAIFVDGSSWSGSDTGVAGSGKTMGSVALIR